MAKKISDKELNDKFNKTADNLTDMINVAMELVAGNNEVREQLKSKFKTKK